MWANHADPNAETQALIAYAIARGKREILEDLGTAVSSKGETMPRYVRDFATLHDYVDANEYGGLCEEHLFPLLSPYANEIQGALDGWLGDRYNAALERADVPFTFTITED